ERMTYCPRGCPIAFQVVASVPVPSRRAVCTTALSLARRTSTREYGEPWPRLQALDAPDSLIATRPDTDVPLPGALRLAWAGSAGSTANARPPVAVTASRRAVRPRRRTRRGMGGGVPM